MSSPALHIRTFHLCLYFLHLPGVTRESRDFLHNSFDKTHLKWKHKAISFMNQIKSPFIVGMGSSFILKLELSKSLTRVSAAVLKQEGSLCSLYFCWYHCEQLNLCESWEDRRNVSLSGLWCPVVSRWKCSVPIFSCKTQLHNSQCWFIYSSIIRLNFY